MFNGRSNSILIHPKVAVVVLSYNRPSDLNDCISSILAQTYSPIDLIVIDNNSSVQIDGQIVGTGLFVRLKSNLGWGGGNNFGLRTAMERENDYALLVNDDAVLAPDCIEKLVSVARSFPKVGIVGPIIYYYSDKKRVWHAGGHFDIKVLKASTRGLSQVDSGQFDDIGQFFVSGCCMMISRQLISTIGYLEDRWFMGREEDDFNLRAQKAGFLTLVVASAKAWHKVALRSKIESTNLEYMNGLSTFLLIQKHFGKWSVIRFFLIQSTFTLFGLARTLNSRRDSVESRPSLPKLISILCASLDFVFFCIKGRETSLSLVNMTHLPGYRLFTSLSSR